jgi:hypothetical protein
MPRKKPIGFPLGQRVLADPAEHAQDFAYQWRDKLEDQCRRRMKQLGIPDHQIGQPDYGGDGRWGAFDPYERQGGKNTTGVVIDSGVLNPELLKGMKGGRIWASMRLKDRIDAIIAHEYEELRAGGLHAEALKAAANTELPISDEARRLNRARAR